MEEHSQFFHECIALGAGLVVGRFISWGISWSKHGTEGVQGLQRLF